MKNFKKVIALLVAALLVVSMSSAFAATVTLTTLPGHTYEIFQVFTGTVDTDGKTLTELKYGASAKGEAGKFVSPTDLASLQENAALTDEHEIIDAYSTYVDFTKPYKTVSAGTASADLEPGFYVIRDQNDQVPSGEDYKNDSTTLYMFQVLNENFSSSAKAGTVESKKKVDDNDGDGTLIDSADYDIGDTIPYTLTFKLPDNYAKFETYYVNFIDTLTSGLTYNGDAKIYYGASDTTGTSIDFGSGLNLSYEIPDLKKVANLNAGDVLTIKYTCYLNAGAEIGATGNPNTYKVQFSNNPNKSGEGEENPHGETPEDKNIVFTYKTVFDKVDENNAPLVGADFTLYKDDVDVTTLGTSAHPVKVGDSTGTHFEFKGLDAGNYELVETTTPKGYNTIAPIKFTITAEHEIESDDPRLTSLLGTDGKEFIMTSDTSAGSLTSSVVNKSGAVLPSTGGIGTTIFYVAGSIMVLAAAILLVTKRRMNAED